MAATDAGADATDASGPTSSAPIPMAMLAEVTHRCPLKCPYCSNPLELVRRNEELSTEEWIDVFRQAAEMGVLHLHLSGGEPAARRDLEELTAAASTLDLYTNLITSGVGLTAERVAALVERGLDHVQLSIQGADAAQANRIGGYRSGHETKLRVAEWIRAEGVPLTVNAVVHRQNLDDLPEIIALAERLGAKRLEVANTQYHGWAYVNRAALMPTREQALRASRIVDDARTRLAGAMVIDYVPPDYLGRYPKPCMGGWARFGLNVTPNGRVLPCHAAETIPTLRFETVRERPLAAIWADGPAFTAFRGTDWMPEPCRGCERKEVDWGGCRCQAFAFTGDAANTDPACSRSPLHDEMRRVAEADAAMPRDAAFTPRAFA
ncbi:pyrroloquinoline quinone biosynthesis protein PqqE [Acuticoccus sediminis]|uniref:PqqA peptide cyclase n=2 Tax=Acuticoccus sediminis TaxID=2184697 RepID=A0A8B2NL53_9HYPH|nr:pyrroloquinoline quinone biosynthesis protein PqqE [Acuticoccus sediminis]